jgi:hypothetical protein
MAKASSASLTRRTGWRRAIDLPLADLLLFAEAFVRLGVVRLMIVVLPFRILAKRLGEQHAETTRDDEAPAAEVVRRVRWAVLAASHRAPWRCKCLEQGITAKQMLRARGIQTTLYLGVARGEKIDAHAWLRCGSLDVCGGAGASRFTIVSTFGAQR